MSKLSDLRSKAAVRRPQVHMETYQKGHAMTAAYNVLPSPITTVYCLIGSGSILGMAYFAGDSFFKDSDGNGRGYLFSIVALAVMTLISLVALGWRHRKSKLQAENVESLEDAVKASAAGGESPAGKDEPAKMDHLRSEFRRGVELFTSHGKDLYSFPWYVLVGEPGSGKSEAIRRSELKFPDRLQNKMQGVGGTVSMHWWFTNQAIILDTAGAMLTRPEAANRFSEFLHLLRSHRPDCPINGMILTIPVDSLKVDDSAAIERKASGIAAQLGIIQQALDVRFPIYLMISKSDRLPGWREFFDAPGQAKYERQMMGWANPDPLDTPFEPERIGDAIGEIADRLRMRSLALLSDPIARKPDGRRTDEVDSLYTFPGHLRGLIPGLKTYLETIFDTGEWASRPPFFRGVFFTSALQEGSQLDTELAKVLGIPVENLPSEGVYVREKAVFLRDMFLEKIFPEHGLVTRLTSVGKHLRKRLVTFYGIALALVALMLGWAYLIKNSLEAQMETEDKAWGAINGTWKNGELLPIISDDGLDEAIPQSRGSTTQPTSRTDLLEDVLNRTAKPLPFAWVFRPIPVWRAYEKRRREAALTVAESSLLKPLVDGARRKIIADTAATAAMDKDTKDRMIRAFGQLSRLESWIGGSPTPQKPEEWTDFFKDLAAYVAPSQVALPTASEKESLQGQATEGTAPDSPETKPASAVTTPQHTPATEFGSKAKLKDISVVAATLFSDAGSSPAFSLAGRTWLSEDSNGIGGGALTAAVEFIEGESKHLEEAIQQRSQEKSSLADLEGRWKKAEAALFALANDSDTDWRKADMRIRELADVLSGVHPNETPGTNLLSVDALSEALAHAVATTQPSGLESTPGAKVLRSLGPRIEKLYEALPSSTRTDTPEVTEAWTTRRDDLEKMQAAFKERKSPLKPAIGSLKQVLDACAPKLHPDDDGVDTKADRLTSICSYLRRFLDRNLEDTLLTEYLKYARTELRGILLWPLVQEKTSGRYDAMPALQKAKGILGKFKEDADAFTGRTRTDSESKAATELDTLFGHLKTVLDLHAALSGEPKLVLPSRPKDEDEEKTEIVRGKQGLLGIGKEPDREITKKVPKGVQRLVWEQSDTLVPIGSGPTEPIAWAVFDKLMVKAELAQGTNVAPRFSETETIFALERMMAKDLKEPIIPLRLPEAGGMAVRIKTEPALPIGRWPSRKDFRLDP